MDDTTTRTVAPAATPAVATTNRRRLLLGGAVSALGAGAALDAGRQASAAGEPPVLLGTGNTTNRPTAIANNEAGASVAFSASVLGNSNGYALSATGGQWGVFAIGRDAGVAAGASDMNGFGLYGSIDNESRGTGGGVRGQANGPQSVGVLGQSPNTGVCGSTGQRPAPMAVPVGVHGVGTMTDAGPGLGGIFEGERAAIRLVPSLSAGAPTSGQHLIGEIVVDRVGRIFLCTVSGSAGRWVELIATAPIPDPKDPAPTTTTTTSTTSPSTTTTTVDQEPPVVRRSTLVVLPRPERFVDTRSGLGGVQGPLVGAGQEMYVITGRTGERNDPALVIPDDATAIVGNVAAIGASRVALGSFLTLWGEGPRPATANVNFGPADVTGAIANSVLVALSPPNDGHRSLQVFHNTSCDYVLDVTGYYVEA